MERNPDFLKKKYGNLHISDEVDSAVHRHELREGKKVSNKPNERIQVYLDRFKEITEREDEEDRGKGINALKEVLYKQYISIESGEDIPEAHIELQRRIAREQGHGDVEIDEGKLDEYAEIIRADQKQSLDQWVDYLASPDAMYPDWLKYWAMRSVLNLSDYDKEKKAFGNRSKDTTKPFPDLNHEALAYVLDVIQKRATGSTVDNPVQERQNEFAAEGKKVISDEEFQKMLSAENFSKLYAFAIEHVTADHSELYKITDGEWVVYPKGSPGHELARSLQGHGTGWCTAGEATANAQLKQGDFYVYYSKNPHGDATIPRLAIRMEEDKIAEVRGVAHKQEIDQYISPVLEEKLGEFGPEANEYRKKTEDMKRLTEIDTRNKAGEELSKEDLSFIYEVNRQISGFGYTRDPRINEILKQRNKSEDIAFIIGVEGQELNSDTALQMIRSGRIAELSSFLSYFSNLSPEVANLLIKNGNDWFVSRNIESFSGLTPEIAEHFSRKHDMIANNLSRFQDLPLETAYRLIDTGYIGSVFAHNEKFKGLDILKVISSILESGSASILLNELYRVKNLSTEAANLILDKGEGDIILLNLRSFVNLDLNVLKKLAKYAEERGDRVYKEYRGVLNVYRASFAVSDEEWEEVVK